MQSLVIWRRMYEGMATNSEKREKICTLLRRAKIVADDVGDALTSYLIATALEEAEHRVIGTNDLGGRAN